MTFYKLSGYLQKLEDTASRNEITKILSQLFDQARLYEIDKICYLILGELVPAYRGVEFNLAERMMVQIIARAYGRSRQQVQKFYKTRGDLGDVAAALAANSKLNPITPIKLGIKSVPILSGPDLRVKNSKLSVSEVYNRLMDIAQEKGEGSQETKIVKTAQLLAQLDPQSAKFVARIPVSKLRLGFSNATILDALSVMEKGDKSARVAIERAYNVTADIGKIAYHVKKGGIGSLSHLLSEPGVPIRPSLAERLPSGKKILEKIGGKVIIEPKLDGFRVQVHVWKDPSVGGEKKVALFSRNLENTTAMFPEIVRAVKKLAVDEIILDGEAIGYHPKTGKFVPFQETIQRKRKYDIEEMAKKLPLKIFVFDVLYLDGKSLLAEPFTKRREILEKIIGRGKDGVGLTVQKITDDDAVIERELVNNLNNGLEGLVAKKPDAPYRAGGRGFHWIKLKAASRALEHLRGGRKLAKQSGLLDTVDCVVMGAYRGRGKRAEFGVGGFLLGVKGAGQKYYSITRLGTGLSDDQFKEAHQRIGEIKVDNKPQEYEVVKEGAPDIWLKPDLVVEILADEITLSPHHTAGAKAGRGFSLRFPRLVRFRNDKRPEDATGVGEIAAMYKLQSKK